MLRRHNSVIAVGEPGGFSVFKFELPVPMIHRHANRLPVDQVGGGLDGELLAGFSRDLQLHTTIGQTNGLKLLASRALPGLPVVFDALDTPVIGREDAKARCGR